MRIKETIKNVTIATWAIAWRMMVILGIILIVLTCIFGVEPIKVFVEFLMTLFLLHPCGSSIHSRAVSPDHTKIATEQVISCGALAHGGRLINLDSGSDETELISIHNDEPVKMRWLDAHHLEITYTAPPIEDMPYLSHDNKPVQKWRDVQIIYHEKPNP